MHGLEDFVGYRKVATYDDLLRILSGLDKNMFNIRKKPVVSILGLVCSIGLDCFLELMKRDMFLAILNPKDSSYGTQLWLKAIECDIIIDFKVKKNAKILSWSPKKKLQLTDFKASILLKTSGSTGLPKTVVHKAVDHFRSALINNRAVSFSSPHVWLLALPVHHVGGLSIIFRVLAAAATLIAVKDKESLLTALQDNSVSHVSLVAAQLEWLLERTKSKSTLSRLECILLGGSSISQALVDRCILQKIPLCISYGMTETASMIAMRTVPDKGYQLIPPNKLRISKAREISICGPALFEGYFEKASIRKSKDELDYFPTGDLGELQKDGSLKIIGRKDNLIVSGGENIYPEEIEKELMAIAGVRRALVFPAAHKEFGECPEAIIEGSSLSKISLKQELIKKLPNYKIPKEFYFWPKNAQLINHKISRKKIADEYGKSLEIMP